MSVREHKTGSESYINHIGPLIDPQHKIDRLLVLSGPRELTNVTNVHSYIQAVGHGFSAPSSTKVRKIGSLTVWLQCGEAEANLISGQLSHSVHTHTGPT